MSKTKLIRFNAKDVIEAARAEALGYATKNKNKTENRMTPKQRKARIIAKKALLVGGCQHEPLLDLLAEITGLPISDFKETKDRYHGTKYEFNHLDSAWFESHPFMVIHAPSTELTVMSMGKNGGYVSNKGSANERHFDGYGFDTCDKEAINGFFDEFPPSGIGHLVVAFMD